MQRLFSLVLGGTLLTTAACARDPRPAGDTLAAQSSGTADVAGDSAARSVATADPDTVGCELRARPLFIDGPLDVVRAYVDRDTAGAFRSPDERLFELLACPGHLGGGDSWAIVSGARIVPERILPDSAHVLVLWDRLALAGQGFGDDGLEFRRGTDTSRVLAVRTAYGWRLDGDFGVHVSPGAALKWGDAKSTADQDSLRAAATLPPEGT